MDPGLHISFGHFRLDTTTQRLWRGRKGISLAPKEFAALCFLVERAGRLVTKDELRQAVWDDPLASDASLKVCVGGIRKALGDNCRQRRIISTVHRRGYRFIAPVSLVSSATLRRGDLKNSTTDHDASTCQSPMVGRERALAQVDHCLHQALQGNRQVVFITGQSGIGKTTLVDAVLRDVNTNEKVWTASGQCLLHHVPGEAYQPVLEALGRLAQQPGRERLVAILARYAPTWLMQLPAIHGWANRDKGTTSSRTADRDRDSAALATSSARMLREMDEALTALAAETALVLVFEDLHTCDYATIDLISLLARRRDHGKLLLICTYRPTAATVNSHPVKSLKHDLQSHGQCHEVELALLTVVAVEEYLHAKFPANCFPVEFPQLIHEHTDGHPLFMVELLRYLQERQVIVDVDGLWILTQPAEDATAALPESIRRLIEESIEQLAPVDRHLLAVAAIQGLQFDTVVTAESALLDVEEVEQRMQVIDHDLSLVRLIGEKEFPDGTLTRRYEFVHRMHHRAFQASLTPTRKTDLGASVAESLLAHHCGAGADIAVELARLFESARNYLDAAKFSLLAAQLASHRCDDQEATALAQHAVVLLASSPPSLERLALEHELQSFLKTPVRMHWNRAR